MRYCECGCGKLVKEENRFILGHNTNIRPNLTSSPTLSYVLGVLLGDGSVVKSYHYAVQMPTVDQRFVESFSDALTQLGLHPNICIIKKGAYRSQYKATAYSVIFYNWFKDLSFDKFKEIINQFPALFIRGFYESEGCFSTCFMLHSGYKLGGTAIYRFVFVNTNRKLLMLVKDNLLKLGIKLRLRGPLQPTVGRLKNGRKIVGRKPFYRLETSSLKVIKRFLNTIKPSIKFSGLTMDEETETERVRPDILQAALLHKILQAQRETLQFLKDVTPQGVDVPFDDQVVTGVTTIDLIKNYPYRPLRSIDFFNKGSDTAYIRINEDGKEISIENREAISVERPKATIRYITLRVGTAETSTIRLLGHY